MSAATPSSVSPPGVVSSKRMESEGVTISFALLSGEDTVYVFGAAYDENATIADINNAVNVCFMFFKVVVI